MYTRWMLNIRTHTHTHNASHIEFVWACMSKQQQLKQKLARNVKQLLKIQVMLHVCTVHACMYRIPAMRMHLKTGMRNVDFVCVGMHRICEIVLKLSPNCVCMNIKCIHLWSEAKPKASVSLWSGLLWMQQASSLYNVLLMSQFDFISFIHVIYDVHVYSQFFALCPFFR